MLESGEIRPQSAKKILRRKLQLFSTTGSVALWSETKYKTITLQFGGRSRNENIRMTSQVGDPFALGL
jgi:hypothetical protein